MHVESPRRNLALSHLIVAALATTGLPAGAISRSLRQGGLDLFAGDRRREAVKFLTPVAPGGKDICMVNVHGPVDNASKEYVSFAGENQRAYAERHHYKYFVFEGRISGDAFINVAGGDLTTRYGGGLNWQKLSGLAAVSAAHSNGRADCQWMMWLDSDVIFTNATVTLEHLIQKYNNDRTRKDIILSEENDEAGCFVNSGVFLLKNSEQGRQFINTVANMYEQYKQLDYTSTTEQNAIQHYAYGKDVSRLELGMRAALDQGMRPEIAVAPQRMMNSFYWPGGTNETGLWRPCDFIAHLPGGSPDRRIDGMREAMRLTKDCQHNALQ